MMGRLRFAAVVACAVGVTVLDAGTSSAQVFPYYSIGRGVGLGWPVGGYGYGPSYGLGYRPYGFTPYGLAPYGLAPYGGFGAYPGYGLGFYSSPAYYSTYTYSYVPARTTPAYVSAPGPMYSSVRSLNYQAAYPPTATDGRTALIRVRVPADAEVSFNGEKSDQKGTERTFRTKPLQPDTINTFEVKASWKENDKPVERTQKVRVMAGEEVSVSLMNAAP
jgi:uncharacterized protein (TIGR03000 family)